MITRFSALLGVLLATSGSQARQTSAPQGGWTATFGVDKADLASTGRNSYFILEPGYTLTLEHGTVRLVVTVTVQTKTIDGVETRVVEEINPIEVSSSKCRATTSRSARRRRACSTSAKMSTCTRTAGSPATRVPGSQESAALGSGWPWRGSHWSSRYYQEIAPGVAMDRARIVSVTDTLATPAGRFAGVLVCEETTQLEPGKEYKRYAPGIGLIQDGDLKLVSRR